MRELLDKLLYVYGIQVAPAPQRLARRARFTGTIEVMLSSGRWKKLHAGWENYFRPGAHL
jgi:hypothetical protein